MILDGIIVCLVDVCKSCTRVYKGDALRFSIRHIYIVYFHTAQGYFKVCIPVQQLDPLGVSFFLIFAYMSRLIIATHLEVASIFAETHGEHTVLDHFLLLHAIIDGLETIQILARLLLAEAEDTICFLRIEVLRLLVDAAKGILEHIDAIVIVFSQVEHIFAEVAIVG